MRREKFRQSTLIMLFCLLVAGALTAAPYTRLRLGWLDLTGALERAELYTLDQRFQIRGERKLDPEIAIIAVDEASLRQYGKWPWPRTLHAQLIDALRDAGAKVVAFDVVFDMPASGTEGRAADTRLEEAIARSRRVVLAAQYEPTIAGGDRGESAARKLTHIDREWVLDERLKALATAAQKMPRAAAGAPVWLGDATVDLFWSLPRALFLEHADTGFINIPTDKDAIYRRARLLHAVNDGTLYPNLSLAVVACALDIPLSKLEVLNGGIRLGPLAIPVEGDGTLLVDYPGGPTAFPRYSFAEVLRMDEDERRQEFKDRILFVGATTPGSFDIRPSPFAKGDGGGDDTNMGVYTLASVTDTLLQKRFFQHLSPGVTACILFLFALYLGYALAAYPMWEAVGAATLLFAAYGLVGVALFNQSQLVMPMAAPLLSIAVNLTVVMSYRFRVEYNERKRLRGYMDSYVSPEVASLVMSRPEAAKPGWGERREVTVLFSDIRGFTPMSEKMAPGEVASMLCRYFTEMVDVVMAQRGMVNNFIGDALVGVWNAPMDQPDHARRAVLAGLEMMRAFDRLQQEWAAAGQPTFRIGIGVNTGPVFAGNIGMEGRKKQSVHRMQYTVIGDSVNAAARLEALNKEMGTSFLIGESTYAQVADLVEARALPPVRVKGKSEPLLVYEVLGLKSQDEPVPLPASPRPVPAACGASARRRHPLAPLAGARFSLRRRRPAA
jgi:adenylate cyclase